MQGGVLFQNEKHNKMSLTTGEFPVVRNLVSKMKKPDKMSLATCEFPIARNLKVSYSIALNTSHPWIVPACVLLLALNKIVDPFTSDKELESNNELMND